MADLMVLYASAGGCAQSIAERIHGEAAAHGYDAEVSEMNRFYKTIESDFVTHSLVILVASTTGHGDPPDNGGRFWRKLKKGTLAKDLLRGTDFAVLGLGDTNYDEFCHFGKQLDKRLDALGARRVIELGCADDAVGLDAVVEPWLTALWAALAQRSSSAAAPAAGAPATPVAAAVPSPPRHSTPLLKGGVWSGIVGGGGAAAAAAGPATGLATTPAAASSERTLAVLYASQGGCAQSIAQRIHDEAIELGTCVCEPRSQMMTVVHLVVHLVQILLTVC